MAAGWRAEKHMSEIKTVRQEAIDLSNPEPGLKRQVLAHNKNLMLVRHLMRKGWHGARHSHPHDQLVYIIKGHLNFIGGDSSFEVKTGDSFVVPGGTQHQASALEDSEVLDIFHPWREDYAPVHGLE